MRHEMMQDIEEDRDKEIHSVISDLGIEDTEDVRERLYELWLEGFASGQQLEYSYPS